MNLPKIFWLWRVNGDEQWQGVADTFGQAQHDVQACMEKGGTAAVVESARLVFNYSTMRREYERTGRRSTARREGGRIHWTPVTWAPAEPA